MLLGAYVRPGGVYFRVWAPDHRTLSVVLQQTVICPLKRGPGGYFSGFVAGAGPGMRYRYRLPDGSQFPDPASSYQPEGPHGPSEVVDARRFRWTDRAWRGLTLERQVFYELHVGAFTPEGTLDAAARRLPDLKRLGVTAVELMPVNEFAGRRNWGYDGVGLFAPFHGYGDYEALKRFIDRAHAIGLGVLLDVVYNHLGPDGCYHAQFSRDYFKPNTTEWGQELNFDGRRSAGVREFFIQNAAYWVREFHADGLRLDATQNIRDRRRPHVLAEIGARARLAAKGRRILLVAENDAEDPRCLEPVQRGGFGLDAVWNDDHHHAMRVAMTGKAPAYYADFTGHAGELVSAARKGYLYRGQDSVYQKRPRGGVTPLPAPLSSFVIYNQNHDQVSNSQRGERLNRLVPAPIYRALTGYFLLLPNTPLLFMGQEFGATTPFPFFTDFGSPLAVAVRKGRRQFLGQFPDLASAAAQRKIPDPNEEATFRMAVLRWSERRRQHRHWRFTQDLLHLREDNPAVRDPEPTRLDGAALADRTLLLRFYGDEPDEDRLLIAHWGERMDPRPLSEPLAGLPAGLRWVCRWSSEDPRYGGKGRPYRELSAPLRFQGPVAMWHAPAR